MGFVIGRMNETVVQLPCVSWLDDPTVHRLMLGQDAVSRSTSWVRGIVLHTTAGVPGGRDLRPQKILPGLGPKTATPRVGKFWSRELRHAGAHLVVDHDGTIVCLADLLGARALHAGAVNDCTIGIEIFQGADAEMYDEQLAIVVRLVDWLTARFGIQRQIPRSYRGPITRLAAGGRDVVGVYGHRDVTDRRGIGDPGGEIMRRLADAGYEPRDFEAKEDLREWSQRQKFLNSGYRSGLLVDGIPGKATWRALREAGRVAGMWIPRPGDEDVGGDLDEDVPETATGSSF